MTDNIDERYIYKLISSNIKRLRSLQNISQLSLALSAGLTHNFINDIENCKKGISAKTLAKLSGVFNVEPYQFFLPDNFSDNEVGLYMNDFSASIQKAVKEVADQYLSRKAIEKK